MPGRYGDLLWSLPTARAIAEANGGQVDFAVSQKYGSIVSLLQRQSYIRHATCAFWWDVRETAPITPWAFPEAEDLPEYTQVIHLGYRGWPDQPLPYCLYAQTQREYPSLMMASLDLTVPWITVVNREEKYRCGIAIGFTDEYFELKFGLTDLVDRAFRTTLPLYFLVAEGSRWHHEGQVNPCPWNEAASRIHGADVFLGCCSALHVLAVAIGRPCVVMEPNPQRLHPIFWPLGQDGPQVTLVRGNDGQATFDARHVAEALQKVLHHV